MAEWTNGVGEAKNRGNDPGPSDNPATDLALFLQTSANGNTFGREDWADIAAEAQHGCAPAQYIVGISFEESGNLETAREWYQRSAAQQYLPAVKKVARPAPRPAA